MKFTFSLKLNCFSLRIPTVCLLSISWLAHSQAIDDSRLVPLGFTNGQFHFRLNAETNRDYVIDASSNLVDWVSVLEQPQAPGPLEVVDPFASELLCPASSTRLKKI